MKKCLITFIIAVISIIPIYNVKASDITLKDLPALPTEEYEYYTVVNDLDNKTRIYYFTNIYHTSKLEKNTYIVMAALRFGYGETSSLGSTLYRYKTKAYVLENGTWTYEGENTSQYAFPSTFGLTYDQVNNDPVTYYKPIILDRIIYTNMNYVFYYNTKYTELFDASYFDKNVPIEYTQEKIVQDNTVYNDYYKFTLFTSSYNSEYTYKYKIGNGAWIDVSSTIENSVNFNVFYNSTVYMAVVDNEGNYVYTTTYTINDLLDQKEYETPSITYDVSYGEEFKTGLKYANVTFKIKNYSAAFSYHYSLDDTNDIIINNRDIVDSEYTYKTYQNVTIYFYVYDLDGNVVFNNSYTLTGVTNYDKLYTYEIPISDFYDKENNKLKYLTLYYESSKNSTEDIYLSLSTFLAYSDLQPTKTKIPFYFINKNKVTDLQDYVNNIDFSYFTYFDLPYEYLTSTTNYFNYTSYNVFTLLPYYDFQNKVESSSKVIIKSNVELKILGYKETDYFYEFTTSGSDYEYFSNLINKILTPIYEKLPILGQFKEIYKTFNYDYHHDTIPRYTVDLSYFGGDSETTVIDFTNFIDYRMYIFNFIKILLAYETLRVVIKNIKNSGGDS